jgi:hypothetical protein
MSLKARLDRLERRQPAPEANRLPPRFWDLLWGVIEPEDLEPFEQEQIRRFLEGGEAEHARCMEDHPAGKFYRQELTRLGLPQPPTLAGIDDIIEECLRLACIPTPGTNTNGHLSGMSGTEPDQGASRNRGGGAS